MTDLSRTASSHLLRQGAMAMDVNGTPLQDVLYGSEDADTLSGGAGSDQLHGRGGDDKLYGGEHNDKLNGGAGNDLLDGGSGDDQLEDAEGEDVLLGGDGNDSLSAGAASTGSLDGGSGDDSLSAYSGADLAGGIGKDTIRLTLAGSGVTQSTVSGGDGDDLIQLTLRSPHDARVTISGGAGIDTYTLIEPTASTGSSQLRIEDFAAGPGGDVINLNPMPIWGPAGSPFSNGTLRLRASGANTLLELRQAGTDNYRILLELANVTPSQLTSDNFIDGLDPRGSTSGLVLRGSAGADTLRGKVLDDQLYGEDGDDYLSGSMGDDLLDGGRGNDTLYGDSGSDRLLGGDGSDRLEDAGVSGNNHLDGGAGDDSLLSRGNGTNVLEGGIGKDRLQGGDGNDTLSGGEDDDTLLVVNTTNTTPHTVSLDGGGGNDQLEVSIGADTTSISARGGAGSDTFSIHALAASLVIQDFSAAEGDMLTLSGLISSEAVGNPFGTAGYLKAVQQGSDVQIWADRDGAAGAEHTWQLAATLTGVQLSSLSGANVTGGWHPSGSSVGMTLIGTAGDDVLTGQDLDDTLRGGAGVDTLRGGGGKDLLEGGDETVFGDTLYGEAGDDTLHGDGGSDQLYGGTGDDLLEGGADSDQLFGGEGNDILRGGDGRDQLTDYSGNSVLDGGEGDDTIHTSNPSPYGSTEVLGQVSLFGGGGNDEIYATMAVDEIDGGSGNDRIMIMAGPDQAENATQPLVVRGGAGDDRMQLQGSASRRPIEASGGLGRDTYQFSGNPAVPLTITDFEAGAGGDVLDILASFGGGEAGNPFGASGRARLLQRGGDTVLQHDSDGATGTAGWVDALILKNTAMASLTGDNFSQGADPAGSNTGHTLTGTAGNDFMSGGQFDDTLRGGDGHDRIEGHQGSDTLYGDAGNDTLSDHAGRNILDGGEGDDWLESDSMDGGILRGGAGNDRLRGGGNGLELDGGSGNDHFHIAAQSYQATARSLTLHGGDGDDLIELNSSAGAALLVTADGGAGRDTYVLADNTQDLLTIVDFQTGEGGDLLDLKAFIPNWQQGDPNPFGPAGRVRVEQRGADTVLLARVATDGMSAFRDIAILKGVAKADLKPGNIVLGFNPDGSQRGRDIGGTAAADDLTGGWLNDTIAGGAGNDQLWGEVGDDHLLGGDGSDVLSGDAMRSWPIGLFTAETGNDTLEGGAGDDELHSLWGNDVLRGGEGNDLLRLDDDLRPDALTTRVAMYGDGGDDLFTVRYSHEASLAVVLEGGAGRDTFAINWLPLRGSVTITDFQAGASGDQIRLKDLPEPARFGPDPFASGYLRFAQRGADTVLEVDRDGTSAGAGFETLMLLRGVNASSLTAANITEGVTPVIVVPPQGVVLSGTSGTDVLGGAAGDDWLDGGDGNDVLAGGRGNDVLIGGAGLDRADYGATLDNFTLTRTVDGLQVRDKRPEGSGTDMLSGVERIAFATDWVAVDIDGAAGQAYRIYRAAFDRAPDLKGMGFWLAALDKGASLHDIAAGFAASQEFADLYGSKPSNADLVMRLYRNILHREPEAAGYTYWVDVLDSKKADLVSVLVAVSESAENQAGVADLIANGILYVPYGG